MDKGEQMIFRLCQAFEFVRKGGILDYFSDAELFKVLVWCECRGFLHYKFDDGKLVFLACRYLIPKFDEDTCHKVPHKHEGKILYIPWGINKSEPSTIRQELKKYLDEHEVETVILYNKKSTKPSIFNRKGVKNGREQKTRTAECTNMAS